MEPPERGDVHTLVRTFDADDVDAFANVTGDDQDRHTSPDAEGRRLVQGLLTASLLTDVGGDLEMLARSMEFHFLRPVYAGDTLRCRWRNERVDERSGGWDVTARVTVERVAGEGFQGEPADRRDDAGDATGADRPAPGEGETVLEATVEGIVRG